MRKNINNGFTFIELIVYIALVTIFVYGAVQFGWNIIYGRIKSNVYTEVTQNLRLASKRILFEIRNASDINSVSATSICMSNSDATRNPTRIYLASGVLRIGWGGGSPVCAALSNDVALTSNLVSVSGLTFTNLTSGSLTKNIRFSLTIDSVNASTRSEFDRSQTFISAAEVRSN
ncbi:hypothetical protein A2V61_02605 [Candidatus Woesebacteria bacterium RBG_19FT_COMBO_47_8]|uniref:Prepilin-type N-terminal cleavage/methylation domain-containing protein n=1 Tax=Candidatus Woesebacteria bacterium RBG_13_46_13 TaxID=1802479 RepID=A0A1F7X3H9_9BACT|nr:MAG: hypothetical protein A2Y68_03450 [Candidatus Woesebacteria bacterium RBG_13_46_13]OGM18106.1 MAG: hypothetical protein A2V61_02605 [Candidatus Woesebacteria bacterium RBG_19FT_COMBO_47_8]HJX59603.1 prepilin-type N-terminal cleavage/methylation domain-containing protein [Patescibacteria group bacterium]